MPIFCLDIEVKPTNVIAEGSYVAQASAITFVDAQSQEEALLKARSYLMDHGWREIKLNTISLPSDSAIAHLETEIASAYWGAVQYGVAATMVAFPTNPDIEASYPQIRTLAKPRSNKH
jgi:hypothetical protein